MKKRSQNATKVLIVDDDPTIRILLRAALKQWSYHIVEAENGEKAWAILQEPDAPQLLILDWVMPKLDGISLCRRIEEKLGFHPYIIFLTTKSGTENIIEGLEAGADEFLLKPFDLAELRIRLFAGERIIKYRVQLAEKNLELQNYITNMKEMAKEHAKELVPFDDLAVILLKIHNALYPICERLLENTEKNKPTVDKIIALQHELNNIIDIVKGVKQDTNQIHKISKQNLLLVENPAVSLIDMSRMRDFFGEDYQAIHEFIRTFISLSKEQLNSIQEAIQTKNVKKGKYYFHLLRGASGNSGIMTMFELCGKGEDAITKKDWESAHQLYSQLVDLLDQISLQASET